MRRFRRSSSRSNRRRKAWKGSQWSLSGSNAWNSAVTPQIGIVNNAWHKVPAGVFNTLSGAPEPDDETLMRSLVSWSIAFRFNASQAANTTLNLRWTFGLIAWDYPFDTPIPIAQQPIPGSDDEFDWIYLISHNDMFVTTAAVNTALAYSAPRFDLEFNSRTRRKMSGGTGILACWGLWFDQLSGGSVNLTVNWAFGENTRSLFALP